MWFLNLLCFDYMILVTVVTAVVSFRPLVPSRFSNLCINIDVRTVWCRIWGFTFSAIAPTMFTPQNRHILKFNNLLQPGYAFKSFQICFNLLSWRGTLGLHFESKITQIGPCVVKLLRLTRKILKFSLRTCKSILDTNVPIYQKVREIGL